MRANWRIGSVWGIPIGLHWSMGLVFGLLTMSLAVVYFPNTIEGQPAALWWIVAVVTSVLFFGSILLHELGHSWVALRRDLPVEGITLFVFGGVAMLGGRPKTAEAEFRIAIAGPIVSFALCGFFTLVWYVSRDLDAVAAPSLWLARLNLILGAFNLLPGFPLDGGRILRAMVWRATNDERRAAQVAMVSGQLLAFGMIGVGVLISLGGNFANGLWLVFLGWFLQNAASAEATGSSVEIALRGVKVADAMGPKEAEVPGRMMVRQLVEDYVMPTGERHYIVSDGDVPRGIVTLKDVTQVPRDKWDWTPLNSVMKPWQTLVTVRPDLPLMDAMRTMDDAQVRQLPVVDGDEVLGLLTREEVLHHIRLRMELAATTA